MPAGDDLRALRAGLPANSADHVANPARVAVMAARDRAMLRLEENAGVMSSGAAMSPAGSMRSFSSWPFAQAVVAVGEGAFEARVGRMTESGTA